MVLVIHEKILIHTMVYVYNFKSAVKNAVKK